MSQRARIKKSGNSKGVAVRKTSLKTSNNTITVGNVTLRGGGNTSSGRKKKTRRKKKK